MTPADHYAEADRLMGEVRSRMDLIHELTQRALSDPNVPARIVENGQAAQQLAAFAQVHATLATVDPNRLSTPERPLTHHGVRPLQPKGSTGEVRMEGAD